MEVKMHMGEDIITVDSSYQNVMDELKKEALIDISKIYIYRNPKGERWIARKYLKFEESKVVLK